MCAEVLKAVAVIKKGLEESHLYGVDREDMCEDDVVWQETAGKEDQHFFYE